MRIPEFSDSHLKGTRCLNTEALIDVASKEKPDLLIGNGDVIDLWVKKEEVIAQNPTVKRLEILSRDIADFADKVSVAHPGGFLKSRAFWLFFSYFEKHCL